MKELEIPVDQITDFIEDVRSQGITKAFAGLPTSPSTQFINKTFNTISNQDPLVISCWFAYGREKIIPGMFSSVLNRLGIARKTGTLFLLLS